MLYLARKLPLQLSAFISGLCFIRLRAPESGDLRHSCLAVGACNSVRVNNTVLVVNASAVPLNISSCLAIQ
jgi:hypothetical protein